MVNFKTSFKFEVGAEIRFDDGPNIELLVKNWLSC